MVEKAKKSKASKNQTVTDINFKFKSIRTSCSKVIDFTGNERVINQAVEAVKIAGTIVHVGMVEKPLTYHNFMYGVVYKELNVTGIFGRRMYETWTEVMNILGAGKIDLKTYIGNEMKLEQLEEAIQVFPEVSGRIVFH